MQNYNEIDKHWRGTLGEAVRALLSLEDTAGARNWFRSTIQSHDFDPQTQSIGELAELMLLNRLQWLRKVNPLGRHKPVIATIVEIKRNIPLAMVKMTDGTLRFVDPSVLSDQQRQDHWEMRRKETLDGQL
jgi:hypothetical protein